MSRFLFYAFVFLLPFQINVLVYSSPLFESGNFNPFTSVFIYLTDLVFLFAFICWGISIYKNEYKEKITYGNALIFIILFLFLILAEISVLFAHDQWLSFNIVLRFVELLLMYFFVVNKVVKVKTIINVFIATMSLQAVFAIMQYLSQGAIGLHLLGEPNIATDMYGIAKIQIDEQLFIRPYGTFPHPNILAGFLLVAILFAYLRIRQKEYIVYPLIILLIAAFVITFSRGAFLALLVSILVYISLKETRISLKYILLGLSLLLFFVVLFNLEQTLFERILFTDVKSITERVFYYNISKKILFAVPFGIGLGNFTLLMPDFTNIKLAPWDFQPVHNIYMLIANEMGVISVLLFLFLIGSFAVLIFLKMKKIGKEFKDKGVILISILAGVFVLGLFDHYLISLYHGQVLTFLLFALYGRYIILKNHL